MTLGRVDLRGPDPAEADTVVRGSKRLALLVYLAAALPRGLQRRDLIITLLWPDKGQARARHALRNTLHELRKRMGPDVIVSRGDEEVGVDPEALWCDAVAFERHLEADEVEAGLELYRGPFLDGFHVTGASREFDRWVEERRRVLARRRNAALESLAEARQRSGRHREAVRWWRRRVEADPCSVRAALGLMRASEAAGDRALALRVAEDHAAALREELGAEPDPAVAALAQRIRTRPGDAAVSRTRLSRASTRTASRDDGIRLVGRDTEWTRLLEAWRAAADGDARLVVIQGEPGIGKTRLAEELLHRVFAETGVLVAEARCYAAEGRLAYDPVAEWLRSEAFLTELEKLEGAARSEVARLLPELHADSEAPPAPPPSDGRRQRFFRALASAVAGGGEEPRLLFLDDLQWCDRETLEWLHYLLRANLPSPLMVLCTLRPEEVPAVHPLRAVLRDLRRLDRLAEIGLSPLSRADVAALGAELVDRQLSPGEVAALHRLTEGNPLFVVETMREGWSVDGPTGAKPEGAPPKADSAAGAEAALPPRVQAVIRSRLAQLSRGSLDLARLAAAIGREFSLSLLLRASSVGEPEVMARLDELWERRILRERGPDAFDFSHDKLREVAYADLAPGKRRLNHGRIADALEELAAADLEVESARLAAQHALAGRPERALGYYERAGREAWRRYAPEEAASHYARALDLLERSARGSGREAHELELRLSLGRSLMRARGWAAPEVGEEYRRAAELARRTGDSPSLRRALWGLQAFHAVRSELEETAAIGKRMLRLARTEGGSPSAVVEARFVLAFSRYLQGRFARAWEHAEAGLAAATDTPRARSEPVVRDPDDGITHGDALVLCLSVAAHAAWQLGRPRQARRLTRQAVGTADARGDPFSQALARTHASLLHQLRGDVEATGRWAAQAAALAGEHGYPYYRAWAGVMLGWTRAAGGEPEEGLQAMREGLDELFATGTRLRASYFLGLRASVCARTGRKAEARSLLVEALELVQRTGERWAEPWLRELRAEVGLEREDLAGRRRRSAEGGGPRLSAEERS